MRAEYASAQPDLHTNPSQVIVMLPPIILHHILKCLLALLGN